MASLKKSIGYIAYPKLGHPSPYSGPMQLQGQQIPDRYKVLGVGEDDVPDSAGATFSNKMASGNKPVKPAKQKFSSLVHADNPSMTANVAHESQHSIFSKLTQQHGSDFTHRLIAKTLGVLSPHERKTLDFLNQQKDPEESIAYAHNYLTDPRYREKLHEMRNLSPKASKNLQTAAKSIFRKMQQHALTLDYPTVQKSFAEEDLVEGELIKREVPVFPKLKVPDRRKEIELVNEPHKLLTKLRAMGHAGARKQYEGGVMAQVPDSPYVQRVPADKGTVKTHQQRAKQEANEEHAKAMLGQTGTAGAVTTGQNVGYALSGVLRPARWASAKENESHGTKQHEEFHSQMNRIENKYGKIARRALVDNLWEALPLSHQNLLNHLQNHWAGDYYEKRNPASAVEEKIARLFNHLNSPETRQQFHEAQFLKTHELPNGDVAPAGSYVVPGENKLYQRESFDSALKDAHRMLLAAGETANENWLRHGHTNSENIAQESYAQAQRAKKERDKMAWPVAKSEVSAHSDTIDHMLGYSQSVYNSCAAASFLSGKPTDEKAFRDALRQHEGDVAFAALVAHGMLPTKENVKALHGVMRIQDLNKSLSETQYEVVAAHPEGEGAASEIQQGISNGDIKSVKLGGKHSSGSLLVRCDEENWLIKPGDNKPSPAAGVAEELATQAEREVAFWHIAEALGLGHIIPRAELMVMNGKQVAAIHMLPFTWKNMDSLKHEEPNIGRLSLEPYRESGELFKWAILDYILGNPDRHGMNLMVSNKDDGYKVALIDHGSAFAGPQFNPGEDTESWVPYYLRVWANRKWKDLTYEERLKNLPRAPAEREPMIFHWLLSINPDKLGAIMQRYGINAVPSLERLNKVKACKEPIDLFIGKLWVL